MIGSKLRRNTLRTDAVFSVASKFFQQGFLIGQWNRKDQRHCCKSCLETKKEEGTPYECKQCLLWKSADAFGDASLLCSTHRICKDCDEKRKCKKCLVAKSKEGFSAGEWSHAARSGKRQGICLHCRCDAQPKKCSSCSLWKPRKDFTAFELKQGEELRKCVACQGAPKKRGLWSCIQCKIYVTQDGFAMWLQTRKNKKPNGKQRCDACSLKQQNAAKQMRVNNVEHIQKHR